MRVLITGGNGFVGRALTRQLSDEHEVAVLDSLRDGPPRFGRAELDRLRFFPVDLRGFPLTAAAVAAFAPDAVIHLAAIHFIPACEQAPDDAIATNTLGTANLLRACPPGTRFVFASTAAVYAPADAPHVEDASRIGPMDVYGLSKLHAEDWVRYLAPQRGLDATIVRLFNVIGPGETNPHLLPAILAQLRRGERTLRLGNTHPRRDYVHVDDVARAFATIAAKANGATEVDVVNVGTGHAVSVRAVVRLLGDAIGEPLAVESDPGRTRPVDRPFLAADIAKVARTYGWTPAIDLADGLRELWREPDLAPALLERF